jgi:hypothetical protein
VGWRGRLTLVIAILGPLVVSLAGLAPVSAGFFAATTNGASTFGTAAIFPTYPVSVGDDSPWAYYRGEESASSSATLTAADSSGNARTGTYNGITNGPATMWKLDENAGTSAADSSGAANRGTLTGSPTWTTGKVGSALSFDGTSQYVAGARAAVNTSTSFSVSAWVYLTAKGTLRTAVSQDGAVVSGFCLQYDDPSDRWAFVVRQADSTSASSDLVSAAGSPALNTWYHLVGVHDSGTQQIKLYVNGSLQGTAAHTSVWNATGALAVGRGKWGGGNTDFWPGRVDEVRLFQRALTASEISSLGNGLPFTDWEFSEGAYGSTADRGPSSSTGTLLNVSWTTSGHDGNAVSFNGTSARVFSNPSALNTSTSYSVSAWVYLTSKAGGINRTAVCQNGDSVCSFRLQYDVGNDRWSFVVSDSDWTGATLTRVLGTASPSLNTWYHLVGVYDSGAGNIKLYVDGSLQGTTAFAAPWNATVTFAVGRGCFGAALNEWWSGTIDTVKTYQRALAASEITDLYNGSAYTEADMTAGLTGALQGAQQGQQSTTAIAFAGMGNASTDTSQSNPTTFTIECWFRSDSTTGGVLLNFGSSKTGVSTDRDRMVYLDSGGKITFGVYPIAQETVRSTATYNDGAWHHVAASLGVAGMKLYLDGALVGSDATVTSAQDIATGYWRWGGDSNAGWPNASSTPFITGTIDEVAVYSSQLTDQQIARHYAADH